MNIKPCPFCGELPEAETWSRGIAVVHRDCGAGIASFSDSPNGDGFGAYGKDEASAVEAWNTRAERTCHKVKEWEDDPCGGGSYVLVCSECDEMLAQDGEDGEFDGPNYCPNCGARVIS